MTELPLSSRVTSPAVVDWPQSVGHTWRHATLDDVDAILDLSREASAVDHPNYTIPREELEEDFTHSYVDVTTDSLLAVGEDGRVDAWGYSMLLPGQETLVRSIVFGGVRPSARGRGLGRALLAWQESRARQQLATSTLTHPGWIMAYADQRQPSAIALLEHAGFEAKRYYLEVGRDLSQPIAERPIAEPLRVVPFTTDLDEVTRLARNDAFRDHWGSQSTNEEQWASFVGGSLLRRDLSFLAITPDDEVAGFVVTSVNEEDWPGQGFSSGYIDLVGVRRDWRGKGVAQSLLSTTLVAIKNAGLDKAVLDVDAENPSGALGLYEGVGFVESNRSINYLKVF